MPRTAAGNCRSVVSESADYLGTTARTPQRMLTADVALTDTAIVSAPRDAMNIVVQQDPRLARQIGEAIEIRRKAASEALAEAAQGVRVASRRGQRKRRAGRVSIASMVVIEIRCQGGSSGRRGGIATDPLTPMGIYPTGCWYGVVRCFRAQRIWLSAGIVPSNGCQSRSRRWPITARRHLATSGQSYPRLN
jgi:CRP-like cAMP-binding protein